MKPKRIINSAIPRMILILLMSATFDLFVALARGDLASAQSDLSEEGRSGAIIMGGEQMIAMLGGAAALFGVFVAEGIAYALILDRVTARGAGKNFSPKLFIVAACALTAAYFYAVMIR